MSEEICYAGAVELAERIRSKQVSPVEVLEAFFRRIESVNPALNAIVTFVDGAADRAREAEAAIMRGESWGPLHGVPFTIKDCIDTAGIRTTRGSRLFSDYVPDSDATAVARMKAAGGIMIGKTNMPEFALWWETSNLVFGRTENPWMRGRTPGGSSGGEAAAIAAGLSPIGVGSDVGGSIREPANYCGIVGLKATHGRIPTTGHWPETLLRFQHVGPMARTVRDVALGLSVLAGPDGLDPYAIDVPLPGLLDLDAELPSLKIGWCVDGPFSPVSADVRATVARAAAALEGLGCRVEPVPLETWVDLEPQGISAAIFTAESSHYLEPIISGREDMLAPVMQRRLALPGPSFEEYVQAVADLEALRQDMVGLLDKYDLLLYPTGPLPAHPHESDPLMIDGEAVPGRNALRATIPADLTGSPAISVPFGWSKDGLPIGVQLVGRHFDEATLLRVAVALETQADFADRRPPV